MAIFLITLPEPQPELEAAIERLFVDNLYRLQPAVWLVSAPLTSFEISAKLGLGDLRNREAEKKGTGVVWMIDHYYGNGDSYIWEWLKARRGDRYG
jgi:hypothetical protein